MSASQPDMEGPANIITLPGRPRDGGPGRRLCARCVLDDSTPGIALDAQGICGYCRQHDEMERQYPTGAAGWQKLEAMAAEIKAAGKGKPFDVIIGVSGGCDSSLLLVKTIELGLRPLAVHYDNTWNSKIATENIHNVLKKLKVELYTHVVDNEVSNDIFRSTMLSGLPTIDLATDLALVTTMYRAAAKYGVHYTFDGHSFRTEGISPAAWGGYVDGKLVKTLVQRFGVYPKHRLRSYPNLPLSSFLYYMLAHRMRRLRPLYYVDYNKEEAKKLLTEQYGWQWYGGYHLENRMTCFGHTYFYPSRTGIDRRPCFYSAFVRSGQMTREAALDILAQPVSADPELVELVKKRLGFSNEAFERVMKSPTRTYRDFATYKETFERMRPFFYLMYKADLVPFSFYAKYCHPVAR